MIEVSLFTKNVGAEAGPNAIPVAPVKLDPEIDTEVPAIPDVGLMLSTTGGSAATLVPAAIRKSSPVIYRI